MLFGVFFAGAGDDLQLGIQAARGEHDVEIRGIGGGGRDQSPSALDMSIAKSLFLGGVTDHDQPIAPIAGCLCFVRLDDYEGSGPGSQFAGDAAADAACAAKNVVIGEPVDIAFHSPPSEKALQLEF